MNTQHGSTLIESLVALAIFSIGMSATAAWVAQSTVTALRAQRLSAAVNLAADLEARMRANRLASLAGCYGADASPCDDGGIARGDMAVLRSTVRRQLGTQATLGAPCQATACGIEMRWSPRGHLLWRFRP